MDGILPPEPDRHDEQLLGEDQEAVNAARDIKDCLVIGETSKALVVCDRMLSLRPGAWLFEGLKLEVENKEREVRLEFIRRLSSEVENTPDLDARINAIQQAVNRYPMESQLAELLRNATAKRELVKALIDEARTEERLDRFDESLKRWRLIRELHPAMPELENEMRRIESLADGQRRIKRRAEFVDGIFRLSSTGEYARAVYQCINALAEYPNDGGLLALRKSVEEKAQHATELQAFISEGITFLQGREIDAALESFAKAKALDESNLQVRYLIGIALLEKARAVMTSDSRKLNALLDEAKGFIPNRPELQTLSFGLDALVEEERERALVRVEHPGADLQRNAAPPPSKPTDPAPTQKHGWFRKLALLGLVFIAAVSVAWLLYALYTKRPRSAGVAVIPAAKSAEIFVDAEKAVESNIQATLDVHIVTDQPDGAVWMDDQFKGEITQPDFIIAGVEPGARVIKVRTPAGEVEVSFEFSPGQMPILGSLPSRQIANVLFAGSADGKLRVLCNCAPAGLRVGDLAELIRADGLEIPLVEGRRQAELWVGKSHTNFALQGSRTPVATIAVFSRFENVPSKQAQNRNVE